VSAKKSKEFLETCIRACQLLHYTVSDGGEMGDVSE